jgi:hypothetical protein
MITPILIMADVQALINRLSDPAVIASIVLFTGSHSLVCLGDPL